jgi:hypothetical protein
MQRKSVISGWLRLINRKLIVAKILQKYLKKATKCESKEVVARILNTWSYVRELLGTDGTVSCVIDYSREMSAGINIGIANKVRQ